MQVTPLLSPKRKNVRQVVRTATKEWGFRYLKLDFLHTAAMPGGVRHAPSVGRGAALHL